MGFPRQEYWSELTVPPLGDLSDPGMEPSVSCSAGRLFTTEPPGKPPYAMQLSRKRKKERKIPEHEKAFSKSRRMIT